APETTCVTGRTGSGNTTSLGVFVNTPSGTPFPTVPSPLLPQQATVPVARRAHAESQPPVTPMASVILPPPGARGKNGSSPKVRMVPEEPPCETIAKVVVPVVPSDTMLSTKFADAVTGLFLWNVRATGVERPACNSTATGSATQLGTVVAFTLLHD